MGQTLSEPVKDKTSDIRNDARLVFASSAMQGWRISMEDAHTTELELANRPGYSFFGVYDGHGGQNVARYSGSNLHQKIAGDTNFPTNIENAIKSGFLAIDDDLRKDPSGCTAVISVITPDNYIYVGNAGDSRAVISIDGTARDMSNDHKPVNPGESSRIHKAGGFVEFGRVNGNLALSRAIGDFEFKQNTNFGPEEQIVTAYPDVQKIKIEPNKTEFLVLACDVVSFIRHELCTKRSLKIACENLMDRCLAKDSELGGIGCDNMTVVIVGFLNGKSLDDWYDWMANRYGSLGPDFSDEVEPRGHTEDYGSMDDENEQDLEIPESPDIDTRPNSGRSTGSIEDDINNYDNQGQPIIPTTPITVVAICEAARLVPESMALPVFEKHKIREMM
ncbi:10788_t:CDS:2 [Entrophospora sp. SA101]|nr:10788_t:CDS:2 [Entrophospora sp. SA101]CAJ0823735.1 8216_t:CDS:2 [Entrophospora sp. SA101]